MTGPRVRDTAPGAAPHTAALRAPDGVGGSSAPHLSGENAQHPIGDADAQPLYVSRKKIHPKSVNGFYRRFKWLLLVITLGIYYGAPWIRWERPFEAPDQAILVDLANRRFHFFFIEIWPQEFYYVAGLLIMAGIGLFLVTSSVGRAWCGYFCPQTVWTDLFMHVERAVEGDRNAQMRLDAAPWGLAKIGKRGLKHLIFLLIAMATGGAWVFYFADAPTLAVALVSGTAAYEAYAAIAILTFTTYGLGALMREQVCTYMCPWPRIQGAMLDERSLTVTYHDWRGEPRGKHRKSAPTDQPRGDCVDCNACVAVCPMGIDIRDGQQLECITCALCIDACDDIMGRLGLEKGLIDYSTLEGYEASKRDKQRRKVGLGAIVKPRTALYFGLWSLVGALMIVSLLARDRLDITVQHDRNPQFVLLSDGSVRNGYTVKILNMRLEPRLFEVTLDGLEGARLRRAETGRAGASSLFVSVGADRVLEMKVFVERKAQYVQSETDDFKFVVDEMTGVETANRDAVFHGPDR